MRVLVLTDDRVGPFMAGSALRAWELARVLLGAGHEVVLSAAAGSSHPEGHGPPVVTKPTWRWADTILSPPWCLPPRAFLGDHLLLDLLRRHGDFEILPGPVVADREGDSGGLWGPVNGKSAEVQSRVTLADAMAIGVVGGAGMGESGAGQFDEIVGKPGFVA